VKAVRHNVRGLSGRGWRWFLEMGNELHLYTLRDLGLCFNFLTVWFLYIAAASIEIDFCWFLQCFDTVGWVISPVKTRPRYDL